MALISSREEWLCETCQLAKTKTSNNKFDFNNKPTDHAGECVEQKDISGKGTGKYSMVMKGNYSLPQQPPDQVDEVVKSRRLQMIQTTSTVYMQSSQNYVGMPNTFMTLGI